MTDRELFYRHLGIPSFYPMDLEIVKAEGVWFFGQDGKEYMDLVAGITVSNTGHRHPKVTRAIHDQVDRYLHLNVYGEFIQSPQVRFAGKLAELLPSTLDSVYFVSSGSEAMEGALKLAKRYTGRTDIVAFTNAYHGGTHGSLSILGSETLRSAFRPLLPGVHHINFNEPDGLNRITERTACVVFETIQAEAGIRWGSSEFIEKLAMRCNQTGTLMILDDVQMGMGRTGRLFSFEHYSFTPDILVLAKALGGGMPLGAFIAGKPLMDTLAFAPELGHITTFGGHPVSCAAGLAGLDVVIHEDLIIQAEEKGRVFQERLMANNAFSAVRRAGLALGVDLSDPGKRRQFMKNALDEGVIIDWYLFTPATFRIAPPLTITPDEIDEACRRLERAASKV